jgi:hypothetical protein
VLRSKQLPHIQQKLKAMCYKNVLFPIVAHERLDLVDRKSSTGVAPVQTTIEIFEREDIAGSLLILGQPGAGKTTELLGLAKYLVERALADPGKIIPIIFELSDWRDPEQSIDDWILDQLCKYSKDCKRHIYKKWLEHQILLPLFDGLDQLGLKTQEKCTLKLNAFAEKYPRMVVCCRTEEFESLDINMNLHGAIELQSLSTEQIKNYLTEMNCVDLWEGIAGNQQMEQMLNPDEDGKPGMLQIPLFISFAAEHYDGVIQFAGKEELLEKYIEQQLLCDKKADRSYASARKWAFKNSGNGPDSQKARFLLSWLARRLKEQNQADFLIEKLQTTWLNVSLILRYRVLLVGAIYLIIKDFFAYPSNILITLLIALTIIKKEICLSRKPLKRWVKESAIGAFVWEETWKGALARAIVLPFVGSGWGIGCSLIAGKFLGVNVEVSSVTILGIACGLFLVACSCLLSLGNENYLKIISLIKIPNQGMYETLINVLWITPLAYILGAIVYCSSLKGIFATSANWTELLQRLISSIYLHPQFPCIFALYAFFFMAEGKSLIKHFCLRIVLFQAGMIPWNYARFLNYCSERRLLQSIGGRYRFIHPEIFCYMAKCRK